MGRDRRGDSRPRLSGMAEPDEAPDTLRLTTAAADLARLYPWLDEAGARLGITNPLLGRMHVALEEAVMNIVMHGETPEGEQIIVRLSAGPALTVEDAGREFDPVTAPEKKPPPGDEPGGLGLKLLRHYCQTLTYSRAGGRNILTMQFS